MSAEWKELITCAFVIDGEFDLEVKCKIYNEIEEVIKKHMMEHKIRRCDRTLMSNQVPSMIEEYEKFLADNY